MKQAFVKFENIPINDDFMFDETYIPAHEVHTVSRIKNIILISYKGISREPGHGLINFEYRCETEDLAKEAIETIFDVMTEMQRYD